jgi:hypothetical protein
MTASAVRSWTVGIRVVEEILRAYLAAELSSDPELRRRVAKMAEIERRPARVLGS